MVIITSYVYENLIGWARVFLRDWIIIMPREDVYFVISIGTVTDSLPLDGTVLAKYLQEAIAKYRKFEEDRDNCGSITELEAIYDIDDLNKGSQLWNNEDGWVGK